LRIIHIKRFDVKETWGLAERGKSDICSPCPKIFGRKEIEIEKKKVYQILI
jgi:hypothetical protein